MSAEQWIGLILALVVMLAGLVGSVLPGLPGTPLVLAAALGHRLWFGAHGAGNLALGALVGLTLFSVGLDYFATVFGARKMGATWRGVVGAMAGALVGIFMGPIAILALPFVGAMVFELVGGRELPDAIRAGGGAVLGMLLGAVGKVACCVAMMTIFAMSVVWNVSGH